MRSPDFTGISSPYEEPENAELIVNTSELGIEESVAEVMKMLESKGVFDAPKSSN